MLYLHQSFFKKKENLDLILNIHRNKINNEFIFEGKTPKINRENTSGNLQKSDKTKCSNISI